MADNGIPDALYINPVTGDPMSPEMVEKQGSMLGAVGRYVGHVAHGIGDLVSAPGVLSQPNPYHEGTEQWYQFEHDRQSGIANFGPQMGTAMLGAGAPMAEAGALGAAGGGLRNKFTGAFKRADAGTDLPANPYKYVATKTQAQPVAANSAEAQARYGFPGEQAAIDPALLEANLARLENPIAQQVAPRPVPVDPRTANLSKLPNGFTFGETEKHILKNYGLAGLSMLPPATAAFLSQRLTPVDFDPFSGT